jgi:outer membrane cobalamin receptor
MKASKALMTAAALALVLPVVGASARTPSEDSNSDHYAYVMVTGSNIPQKVRIKAIGTDTVSPMRVFDRHEIDQTGAFSTEHVLRYDPSLQVHGFGGAGPGN